MIKAAMIVNNHGQARLLKFYEYLVRRAVRRKSRERVDASDAPPPGDQTEDMQQKALRDVYTVLSKRPDSVCNFLEGARRVGCCPCPLAGLPAFPCAADPRRAAASVSGAQIPRLCTGTTRRCTLFSSWTRRRASSASST